MTNYGVKFELIYAKSIKKDLQKVDAIQLIKIKRSLEKLVDFPDTQNIKKLSSHPLADFRYRIGDYRVLLNIDWDNKVIYILKIGHRKEIY